MKYYKEFIDESTFEEKGKLEELVSKLEEKTQMLGMEFSNEGFERAFDNHLVALSIRAFQNEMLESEFDDNEINNDAKMKTNKLFELFQELTNVQASDFEKFLVSTHFMLNAPSKEKED